MKFCQYLNNCTCCQCGENILGPGYVYSRDYDVRYDQNNRLILDRPYPRWLFVNYRKGYKEPHGQTTCEKCAQAIWDREKEMKKQSLQAFFNDPDAIEMLQKKILANKKRPKVQMKIRYALYSISPALSKWQQSRPRVDIEALKLIPIGDLMPDKPKKKLGNNEWFLCPFHEERSASFKWNTKNNKFHCFGCSVSGSSIDLYMKLNNCSFAQAIRKM